MVNALFYIMLCSYIKAKSEVSVIDVKALVEVGLEIFHASQNKLYAQVLRFFFMHYVVGCFIILKFLIFIMILSFTFAD